MDLSRVMEETIQETLKYLKKSRERQELFFDMIGVDEYLCRIGNEAYGVEDFFILSVNDMARFGVHNVTAPEDYEHTDLSLFYKTGKSIKFIRLNQ